MGDPLLSYRSRTYLFATSDHFEILLNQEYSQATFEASFQKIYSDTSGGSSSAYPS